MLRVGLPSLFTQTKPSGSSVPIKPTFNDVRIMPVAAFEAPALKRPSFSCGYTLPYEKHLSCSLQVTAALVGLRDAVLVKDAGIREGLHVRFHAGTW